MNLNQESDSTTMDSPESTAVHVNWEDHFRFDFSRLSPEYSEEEIAEIALRVTTVLNDFESSDIGQFHLSRLQEKFGDAPVTLRLHEQTEDGYKDHAIDLSVRSGWGFLDQNSQSFMEMPLERMLIHEVIHAADPNMPIGPFVYNDDWKTMCEEYATLQTDEFAERFRPDLGNRGAYANAINNDATINEKYTNDITEQIETVDERLDEARTNWSNFSAKM